MSRRYPPKWALKFFRWYCHSEYIEDLEGDLLERFERNLEARNEIEAKRRFIIDVLLLFRPAIIGIRNNTLLFHRIGMLKNYLILGYRNLLKRKLYTSVNLVGLSVGFAAAYIIFLYVQHELSYDQSLPDADRIYKISQAVVDEEGEHVYRTVPYSLVNILHQDYGEVEEATIISGPYNQQVVTLSGDHTGTRHFVENNVLLADSNFLSVFQYDMLVGDARKALREPNSVVLTASTAKRFFGNANPIGQFISPSGRNAVVTGVCQDPPANSHLQFSYLVSSTSVKWLNWPKFNLNAAHCYIKLKENASHVQLESKLPELVRTYVLPEIERIQNISREDYIEAGHGIDYYLHAISELYLNENDLGGFKPGGNWTTLGIFIAMGLLMLIIACINFVNMSIARAFERTSEVGVRRVMGSLRGEVAFQFLMESLIISAISVLIGFLIMITVLPYFNHLIQAELTVQFDSALLVSLVGVIVIVSLVTAGYPAFLMSNLSPVNALKGHIRTGSRRNKLKNGLVSFQFLVAIVFIFITLVMIKQVNHINDKELGFDQEQLMVIEGIPHKEPHRFNPFLNKLKNLLGIQAAAGSLWVPGFNNTWTDNYRVPGQSKDYHLNRILVGDDFMETMGIELVAGESFSVDSRDSTMIILNESAVEAMGLRNPIGQQITLTEDVNGEKLEYDFKVKGVISDFHYYTLHQPISPLVIQSNENNHNRMRFMIARIQAGTSAQVIADVQGIWSDMFPDRPFRFQFLDDALAAKYQGERQTATLLSISSSLIILMACIGLFALSAYTISLRLREVSIRKVLGAGMGDNLMLLSLGFIKMTFLSFLLAAPIGWYISVQWVQSFAYRTSIGPSVFVLTAIIIMTTCLLSVSYHSFKVSLTNPTDSLSGE
ncbi:MAG: ABC transporter permease [Bacteroidota bacterium]